MVFTSPTATGSGGAAATEHPLATQAAITILNAGGNANPDVTAPGSLLIGALESTGGTGVTGGSDLG